MTTQHATERPLWPAIRNGLRLRCPKCGQGELMRRYLKTHAKCPHCAERLDHHRADDGPAYLTILIAGHILAPLLLLTYQMADPRPVVVALVFSVVFTLLALFLLPRCKGLFVAIQWAKRMGGFGAT